METQMCNSQTAQGCQVIQVQWINSLGFLCAFHKAAENKMIFSATFGKPQKDISGTEVPHRHFINKKKNLQACEEIFYDWLPEDRN